MRSDAVRAARVPGKAAYLGVAVVAAIARLIWMLGLRHTPYWHYLMGDAQNFDQWARQILQGTQKAEVFYQAPLYPYFLALIYGMFGHSLGVVRLIQAVLGIVACVLLFDAVARFFEDRRVGLVAGLLLAIYPPAIYFDSLLVRASLAAFLVTLLIWLLSRTCRSEHFAKLTWFGVGVVGGSLLLTRENAAAAIPCVLAWAWWIGKDRRQSVVACSLVMVGVLLVLAPVAAHNASISGRLQIAAASFGPNFYIGNHRGSDGVYHPLRPGRGHIALERNDATLMAEAATGRSLDAAEVSDYWLRRALDDIRGAPFDWLRLLSWKSLLFVHRLELADTQDIYSYAESMPPFGWLLQVLNQGLLWPLAVIGVFVSWPKWRRLWVLGLLLAAYAASIILFFVFDRFRFPAVPLLTAFAAAGLAGLPQCIRAGRWVLPVALAVLMGVAANWPLGRVDELRSTTALNLGARLAQEPGLEQDAIAAYRHALEIDREQPAALNGLGLLLARQGRWSEAVPLFEQALRQDRSFADAHYNLGVALNGIGRPDLARERFKAAIDADPMHADALAALGALLTEENRLPEAEQLLRQAVRIDSGHAGAWNSLGILYARRSDFRSAIDSFERALAADPGNEAARQNLARARAQGPR
ncbi:MAG TPA: tetratricopeptide repeat protein [Candidatus Polarisedimenticolia bacterium]|nr:tetratricopeptide repeat protein [Candidatus Polarisedimenticolia bacterium]